MDLLLRLDIPALPQPIRYGSRILLIGSCFTEHMARRLEAHKFDILSNPHGILFNPLSVASALESYIERRAVRPEDLFELNELWNSWDHHSRFSHPQREAALGGMNAALRGAASYLPTTDWVIVTLGTAYQYFLVEGDRPVANNHRAPAGWFQKRLLSTEEIVDTWTATLESLLSNARGAQVILTVSPVRHARDGAVANNRSKARLLEAVHQLCERFAGRTHYFPAYELVVDVLRDYRFYDLDLAHPNYLATDYVWERFAESCIHPAERPLMEAVREITTAASHRPRFPNTDAHRRFREGYAAKVRALAAQHPALDWRTELAAFEE